MLLPSMSSARVARENACSVRAAADSRPSCARASPRSGGIGKTGTDKLAPYPREKASAVPDASPRSARLGDLEHAHGGARCGEAGRAADLARVSRTRENLWPSEQVRSTASPWLGLRLRH